jgi:hypothetical protein
MARVVAATAVLKTMDFSAFGAPVAPARGIGTDPNLLANDIPWERVLTPAELKTLAALADTFLPADPPHPAASEVGVPDFIDEWISAPYEEQQADQKVVREGLAWFDSFAREAHGHPLAELSLDQRAGLLDNIITPGHAAQQAGGGFYEKIRRLVIGGYYSTPKGWEDIGYVGNRPLAGDWPGPPQEVLDQLGLS